MRLIVFCLCVLFFSMNGWTKNILIAQRWKNNGKNDLQISVPIDKTFKNAVFQHNGYTYFIFSSENKLNLPDLKKLPLVHLKHPSALILRAKFDSDTVPKGSIHKNLLYFQMETEESKKSSLIDMRWLSNGLKLEINNSEIIEFKDPETKEKLIVFMTPYSPIFINKKYDTPEMTFLKTYQGIVIYPKIEKTDILKTSEGFIILNKNPLSMKEDKTVNFYSGLNQASDYSYDEFNSTLNQLKGFIPFVSASGKKRIHLEIAKLYLNNGQAEKALEVLDNPNISSEKNALLFLSYIQLDKIKKALSVWDKIKEPNRYLKTWKNVIDNEKLYDEENLQNITIPQKLAFSFWYQLSRKAFRKDNLNLAKLSLSKMEKIRKNIYQNQKYLYIKALIALREKNDQEASSIFKNIAFNPLSSLSGEIYFLDTLIDLKNNKIEQDQAIRNLEKISPLMLSTALKVKVLERLSSLYYKQNNPVQGLRTDRKLLSITKNISILNRIKEGFEKFFTSHKKRKPLEHVALYFEFKELIPTGKNAVKIKEHLLHDLLELDLLEDAYEVAFKLHKTTKNKTKEEFAIQMFIIANLLDDVSKIKESYTYLPKNWKKYTPPENWSDILKQGWNMYR